MCGSGSECPGAGLSTGLDPQGRDEGLIKLEDADRGVLVGATSLGPHDGEVLGALAVAVHAGVPTATLREMIYAYQRSTGASRTPYATLPQMTSSCARRMRTRDRHFTRRDRREVGQRQLSVFMLVTGAGGAVRAGVVGGQTRRRGHQHHHDQHEAKR